MRTKRLLIRKFQNNDLLNLYKLISDEAVMRYLEAPYSMEKTERFLKEAGLQEVPLLFAVEDLRGNFIGYIIYHAYDEDSYEIGWVLYKTEWNKGYAQELTEAMICDAEKRRKNLIIECVPGQEATKRIALHNNFIFTGHTDHCDVYKLCLVKNSAMPG